MTPMPWHGQMLQAPATWQTVDFISDLHLQATDAATVSAWQRYMAQGEADAVFILGDLFEVWVGDDAAQPGSFEAQCAGVMQAASVRQSVYFMPGNRDFLVGQTYMRRCGATLLSDPTVLAFADQRWLLTHGDALCLDDKPYMQFRAEVRSEAWQAAFLARPLSERKRIAHDLRNQSEARKLASRDTGELWADVDTHAAIGWLMAADSHHMIHGHTHRPAQQAMGKGFTRTVLTDWDVTAQPPRGEVLRLSLDGQLRRASLWN